MGDGLYEELRKRLVAHERLCCNMVLAINNGVDAVQSAAAAVMESRGKLLNDSDLSIPKHEPLDGTD